MQVIFTPDPARRFLLCRHSKLFVTGITKNPGLEKRRGSLSNTYHGRETQEQPLVLPQFRHL
ncbi:MAG: hypothetical protein BWY83_01785 [bacterium ADurb.Bin478]|nr:MAG: hypothetical protein BWY83_01785 [bacterium ADurb.Bin478]